MLWFIVVLKEGEGELQTQTSPEAPKKKKPLQLFYHDLRYWKAWDWPYWCKFLKACIQDSMPFHIKSPASFPSWTPVPSFTKMFIHHPLKFSIAFCKMKESLQVLSFYYSAIGPASVKQFLLNLCSLADRVVVGQEMNKYREGHNS